MRLLFVYCLVVLCFIGRATAQTTKTDPNMGTISVIGYSDNQKKDGLPIVHLGKVEGADIAIRFRIAGHSSTGLKMRIGETGAFIPIMPARNGWTAKVSASQIKPGKLYVSTTTGTKKAIAYIEPVLVAQ